MTFVAALLVALVSGPTALHPSWDRQDPREPLPATFQPAPDDPDDFRPEPGWKPLGQSLWFDPEARRVILRARTCLQEGYLEHLLCRVDSKEHESVFATRAEPKLIHAALILAVGEPGTTVRYRPEFKPPTGPPVEIVAEWEEEGETKRLDARQFVMGERFKKPLEPRWVFAGSETFTEKETGRTLYAADAGDLFTVANFPNAILDLPIASSSSDAERAFIANPETIPPRGTWVTLYLAKPEPVDGP